MDGRWTVKYSKAKLRADGKKPVDIAIPVYGYKSHISIDRMHGVIRRAVVTDAATHDGARLRDGLIQRANTARDDVPCLAIGPRDNGACRQRLPVGREREVAGGQYHVSTAE